MSLGDGTAASAAVLADLAELVGGMRLGESGTVMFLDRQDIQRRVRDAGAATTQFPELHPLLSHLETMGHRLAP